MLPFTHFDRGLDGNHQRLPRDKNAKEREIPVSDDARIVKELVAIKKLLALHLTTVGFSPTAVAKQLGITVASDVRKLFPVTPRSPETKSKKK